MTPCLTCGSILVPLRDDGHCFRCHLGTIGFTFRGGGGDGQDNWNTTRREFIAEHVGEERIRSGEVERA